MLSLRCFGAALSVLSLQAACSAGGEAETASDLSAGSGEPACAPPAFDSAAAIGLERDIVASLAGAADVAPGVRLLDRASTAHRQTARDFLARRFEQLGLTPRIHDYGTGANVYAEVPSTTGSGAWIVLGAHFDTVRRSPGANDNATGVALVYAVARQLSQVPCRSRNIAFVLFDEEEIGLVGSRAFATKLHAEGRAVGAVHTVDQMGWDANGDRLIELERPDAGLADLYRTAAAELGATGRIVVTSTSTSDHSSFRPRFPAVGVTEGYRSGDTSPDYHRPTDTFDKVDFDYLAASTALVARVIENQVR